MDFCLWFKTWMPFAVGFGFSLCLGQFAAQEVVRPLYALVGVDRRNKSAKILGLVERTIYTASTYLGSPEFVGAWLVLKVAGQWGKWSEKEGRAWFNAFLVGTGISLMYGVVGGYLISWIAQHDWSKALTVPLSLIGGSICLICYARHIQHIDS